MIFDSLGIGEMGVVLVLAVILIEPKKLGKVMKEFGKFKRKVSQIQADVKSQIDAITHEAEALEKSEKLKDDKAGMRKWGREQVLAKPAAERAEASLALLEKIVGWPTYGHAKVISCFCGTLNEIDTEPLLKRILADGKILLMPYVHSEVPILHTDLDSTSVGKTEKVLGMAKINQLDLDLVEGAFGIQEPRNELRKEAGEALTPDLVFVPGTCFDLRGGRVGQGMGFYDRYLSRIHPIKVGIGFDVQITQKNLTLDSHDQLMDVVISEKRLLVFSSPRMDTSG